MNGGILMKRKLLKYSLGALVTVTVLTVICFQTFGSGVQDPPGLGVDKIVSDKA